MPAPRTARRRRAAAPTPKRTPSQTKAMRVLARRVKRLEVEIAKAAERHARQLDAVRRAANRRLTVMMQEIAALRHHEARAEALARLLDDRHSPPAEGPSNGKDPRLPG